MCFFKWNKLSKFIKKIKDQFMLKNKRKNLKIYMIFTIDVFLLFIEYIFLYFSKLFKLNIFFINRIVLCFQTL